MAPKLFHISEQENIHQFIPRKSKEQWNYNKYVWAISEEKIYNYLLPRDCPRICINVERKSASWFGLTPLVKENTNAIIYTPKDWYIKIKNCTLFKYEFSVGNFKLIDSIAGYYVSEKTELPLGIIKINNCLEELEKLKIKFVNVSKEEMVEIKEEVVNNLTDFSIIRWSNL